VFTDQLHAHPLYDAQKIKFISDLLIFLLLNSQE
jgi:hypothetical protein